MGGGSKRKGREAGHRGDLAAGFFGVASRKFVVEISWGFFFVTARPLGYITGYKAAGVAAKCLIYNGLRGAVSDPRQPRHLAISDSPSISQSPHA